MLGFHEFQQYMIGDFENAKQIQKAGDDHPRAVHINRVINDRIDNLPGDLGSAIFVLEESLYYWGSGDEQKVVSKPHLFLFRESESGQVELVTYNNPEGINLENGDNSWRLDYNKLEKSWFPPCRYITKADGFHLSASTDLPNGLTFTLSEVIRKDQLQVYEFLTTADGKLAGVATSPEPSNPSFAYKTPLLYDRK